MTTYFVPVDNSFELTRQQLLQECNDLILSTADYMEKFVRSFRRYPDVPSFTWRWMQHFIPRVTHHKVPITPEIIITCAFFTTYIRLRFRYAPRDFFYFPLPTSDSFPSTVTDIISVMESFRLE
ncbi:unnamed protein product [Caenorhabditis sp. 36 PRJEB53466]|nr:unnamed protein product [Caenorhabditis sp. 36 PRJEB53466]